MSTHCGSPGVVRIMMPPTESPAPTSNRVTGVGATSRSRTLMALAVRALMAARLRVRAAREASRDVVTVEPLRRLVA